MKDKVMNKSILEKLYNGEICPFSKINVRTEENRKLQQKISDEEDYFMASLSKEDRIRFEELGYMELDCSTAFGIENFTYGFRLGAKMMLNILQEKDPNYEGI